MKSCPDEKQLSQFLEGHLAAKLFEQLDAHVASCDACQTALEKVTHGRAVPAGLPHGKSFLRDFGKEIGKRVDATAPLVSVDASPAFESILRKIQLDDYEIVSELGRGGMGVVFQAEQISLGRAVALKVIPQSLLDESLAIQRFELEARTAARLQNECIVPVYEVGAEEDFHWYSMRLIEGQSLDEVIKAARRIVKESGGVRQAVLEDVAESMLSGRAPDGLQDSVGLRQGSQDALATKESAGDRSLEQTSKLSSGSTMKIRTRESYYYRVARIGQHVAVAF